MKARLLFGLIATACATSGWALSPTDNQISIQFFMAGATAQKNTLPNVLGGAHAETSTADGFSYDAVAPICAAGSLDIFYDTGSGSNYRAYSCQLVPEASLPDVLKGHNLGGKKILIHLRSRDVLHSFYVPTLRLKQDAVPGMNIPVWFEVAETTKPGDYDLVCAELCGWGHYKMKGNLHVHADEKDFNDWLSKVKAAEEAEKAQ